MSNSNKQNSSPPDGYGPHIVEQPFFDVKQVILAPTSLSSTSGCQTIPLPIPSAVALQLKARTGTQKQTLVQVRILAEAGIGGGEMEDSIPDNCVVRVATKEVQGMPVGPHYRFPYPGIQYS